MSSPAANGGNGIFKWVAGTVVVIMLAGAPGYVALIINSFRTPSRVEVQFVRERQDEVLQRLATLDQQIADLEQDVARLELELQGK